MEFTEILKEKFAEDVGWSFSIFEILTFFLVSISLYRLGLGLKDGMWGFVTMSISEVAFGDSSMVSKVRVIDYVLAGFVTIGTVQLYKCMKQKFFIFISRASKLKVYVNKISTQYANLQAQSVGARLAMANEARALKLEEMKRISLIDGIGLVALTSVFMSAVGLLFGWHSGLVNLIDLAVLSCATIGLGGIFWQTFRLYTARVVPHLVLERVMKNESVNYGDEL